MPRFLRSGHILSKQAFQYMDKSSILNSHEKLAYHQFSMTRMVAFRYSCCDPTWNVGCLLNKAHEEQVARITEVVKSLLKCVCFCAKQGLTFRGQG